MTPLTDLYSYTRSFDTSLGLVICTMTFLKTTPVSFMKQVEGLLSSVLVTTTSCFSVEPNSPLLPLPPLGWTSTIGSVDTSIGLRVRVEGYVRKVKSRNREVYRVILFLVLGYNFPSSKRTEISPEKG